MIDNFNRMNFPYKIKYRPIYKELILTKYVLDDLEGDVDLEDTLEETVITITGDSFEEMWDVLYHLRFK